MLVKCPVDFALVRNPLSDMELMPQVQYGKTPVIAHNAADAADIYSRLIDSVFRPLAQVVQSNNRHAKPYNPVSP